MNTEYDDIINLPHHVSPRHPRMSLQARAAQFAPFSALTGYSDEIEKSARRVEDAYDDDSGNGFDMDQDDSEKF